MYEANKSRIDDIRRRFDDEVAARSPASEGTAREYLEALTDFVDAYNHGPGADPRLVGLDTTGQLGRTEDEVEWAEAERRRVRKMLSGIR
jgi:hypothetical protein